MDAHGTPSRWITLLPNTLTCLRIGMAAAFPLVPPAWWLPIVVAAGASDWLDGWLARGLGVTSRSGALLDGIADKTFMLLALLTLAAADCVEVWQVPVALTRDLAVGVVTVVVLFHRAWAAFRRMDARLAGKLTTVWMFAWFLAVLLELPAPVRLPVFLLAAACSVVAAVDYLRQFLQAVRARRAGPPGA